MSIKSGKRTKASLFAVSAFVFAVAAIMVFIPWSGDDSSAFVLNGIEYESVNESEVVVSGYQEGITVAEIPETVEFGGTIHTVLGIKENAFYNCRTLTSVTVYGAIPIGDLAFAECLLLGSVTVPNATQIGYAAFSGCDSLSYITLPNTTYIGREAFMGCSTLVSVNIPNVTHIEGWAFAACSSLSSVTIPSGVNHIGDGAFLLCMSLSEIVVESGNSDYKVDDTGILYNTDGTKLVACPGKKSGAVDIPSGVVYIADCAFFGCTSVTSVNLPSGITHIGSWAFYCCSALTSANVPSSVTQIGEEAFGRCPALSGIEVDPENSEYRSDGGILYNKAGTELIACPGGKTGAVAIPSGVTSVNCRAFLCCTSVTSVSMPLSMVHIADYAFDGCTSLASVSISSGVTSIGGYAFNGCISLTSVMIPSGVTSIGGYAFDGCSSLSEIEVEPGNSKYRSDGGILYNAEGTELILCPGGKTGTVTIPRDVSSIGLSAFYGCHLVSEIEVEQGNQAYTVADGILYNHDKTELLLYPKGRTGTETIPSGVFVRQSAFAGCSLSEIEVEQGNIHYTVCDGILYDYDGRQIFACPGGKTGVAALPATLTHVDWKIFQYCPGITSYSISNLRYESHDGIIYTNNMTSVLLCPLGFEGEVSVLPGTVVIEECAFGGCVHITSLIVPDTVGMIMPSAFEGFNFFDAENNPILPTADNLAGHRFSGTADRMIMQAEPKMYDLIIQDLDSGTVYAEENIWSDIVEIYLPSAEEFGKPYLAYLDADASGDPYGPGSPIPVSILIETAVGNTVTIYFDTESEEDPPTEYTGNLYANNYVDGDAVSVTFDDTQPNVAMPSLEDIGELGWAKYGYRPDRLNTKADSSGRTFVFGEEVPMGEIPSLAENGVLNVYVIWVKENPLAAEYTVLWKNGNAVFRKYVLSEGAEIVAPSENPVKAEDANYTYRFVNWKGYSDGLTVAADTTFSAVFESVLKSVDTTVPSVEIVQEESDAVILSKGIVDQIVAAAKADGSVNVTFGMGSGKIRMDAGSVSSLTSAEQKVELRKLDESEIAPGMAGEIGDSPVYSVSIGDVRNFAGTLTVSLKYTLKEGENPDDVRIWYIRDDGGFELVPCTYANGYATFETDHLSRYAVMVESTVGMEPVLAAACALLAIMSLFMLATRRR